MGRLLIYLIVLMATAVLIPASGLALSDKKVEIEQKIMPLNCEFVVIDVGSGDLHYLTPSECGEPVPPAPKVNTKEGDGLKRQSKSILESYDGSYLYRDSGIQITEERKQSEDKPCVLLDNFPSYLTEYGAKFSLKQGAEVCFDVVTSLSPPETYKIKIIKIDSDYIVLRFGYAELLVARLESGEEGQYDVNSDGRIDIIISFESTNSDRANVIFKQALLNGETPKDSQVYRSWSIICYAPWALGVLVFLVLLFIIFKKEPYDTD